VRLLAPFMLLVFSLAIMAGCAEKVEVPVAEPAAPYLAATIGVVNRSTKPKTYIGENLYEYINGGAELYHSYGFVEVATAYYAHEGVEVVADIYEFADADNAFGLYSSLRPEDAEIVSLGVEGFLPTGGLVYVKGPFVVKLTGFDDSHGTLDLISALAAPIAEKLPGTSDLPETFGLFPGMYAVEHSERLFAESYMGRQFLTDIYSQDFVLDNDTLRLLLADDNSGAKFLQWSTTAEIDSAVVQTLTDLPFDDGKVLAFRNDYYGTVVAGLKSGYVVGVVNYGNEHEDFLRAWLEEMP